MGSLKFEGLKKLIEQENNASNVYNICDFYNGEYEKVVVSTPEKTNIFSLTKNVIALCIGILIDQGKLSLSSDISEIFIDEYQEAISYQGVRVIDVLHQVTGIKNGFLDIDVDDPASFFYDDYLKIVFEKGIYYHDKTHFVYSDSNYYLLGRVVQKVAKQKLDDFIVSHIFKPLNITDYDFQYDPLHNQMGATGIFVDARDVAKIATIFLNGGEFKGHRIVSKHFIDLAMNDLVNVDDRTEYGYSIWVDKESGLRHGSGMLGQIFVLYDQEIISFVSKDINDKMNPLKVYLLKKDV